MGGRTELNLVSRFLFVLFLYIFLNYLFVIIIIVH
jgi:hypothetical protein